MFLSFGLRVEGLGAWIYGAGFRVQGLGFRIWGEGVGVKVQRLEFVVRVSGCGQE